MSNVRANPVGDEGLPAGKAPASKPPARRSPRTPAPPRAHTGGPAAYPESVQRLIDQFASLPGIGRRSAERLALHVLKSPTETALELARAVEDVKLRVRHCRVCFNLADSSTRDGEPSPEPSERDQLCALCASVPPGGVPGGGVPGSVPGGILESGQAPRDASVVLVVEQPRDLIALEQTGMYRGLYHVLMGHIAPMDGVGPGDLTISDLLERVRDPSRNAGGVPVREVILGLNPTLEGDGTALFLAERLSRAARARGGESEEYGAQGVKVTRLARGVPTGSPLEFASKAVLADAIEGRRPVDRG